MNRARRARLSVIRCEDKATRADARNRPEIAASYRVTAEEWRQVLRDLDAPIDAACDDCGAAEGEDCEDDCDCSMCDCNRALDADFDAWQDRA